MNKTTLISVQNAVMGLGKVSQITLGTWPGARFENPRPFEWIIKPPQSKAKLGKVSQVTLGGAGINIEMCRQTSFGYIIK